MILVGLFSLFLVVNFCTPIQAYNNAPYGPNSETPDKPKYFNFIDTGLGIFKTSHYSTHDWIADAALRYLIMESTNWNWLLDDVLEKNPKWEDKYSDGIRHYPVRSYFSFLFSSQMPDMDPKKVNNARPHKHPQIINLWGQEGEIVGNGDETGVWVGKWYHQTLHYDAIPIGGGQYMFTPKLASGAASQKAPWYAWITSKKAIDCLTHGEETVSGEYEIWSKPEAGACWLGVMSHFIADLASPAHLIGKSDNYYSASPNFHGWFEDQVSRFTLWDESLGGPKGFRSGTDFFNIDMSMISQNIDPIAPYLAAILTSEFAISTSYKHIDDGGLFIEKDNPIQENLISRGSSTYWEWNAPGKERNSNAEIIPGSLTYKQYYDKVEYLLNLAIYFTAAAMKWTMKKVKETATPVYDQWAKTQYKDKYPDQAMPDENPPSLDDSDDSKDIRDAYKGALVLGAMLAPLFALVIIPVVIVIVVKN